jgi:hypothetical protein
MAARAAGAIRPKGGVAGFGFVLARRADLRRFLGLKLGLPAYARRGALSEPFPMLSVNIPRGAKLNASSSRRTAKSGKAPCGLTFSRESARKRIGVTQLYSWRRLDRLALWNELQAHAGTRLRFRLSSGDRADDHRRDHSLHLFKTKKWL